MTKKDIVLVARVLYDLKPIIAPAPWTRTVNAFSEALAQENPRFKIGAFEKMCEKGSPLTAAEQERLDDLRMDAGGLNDRGRDELEWLESRE